MIKLYGVRTVTGQDIFLNIEHIVDLTVQEEGVRLEMVNGCTHTVVGEYVMTLIQTLSVLELIPIGEPATDETDVNNTEFVDVTTDGLEEPVAVELREYDEVSDGHPELEQEQFGGMDAIHNA